MNYSDALPRDFPVHLIPHVVDKIRQSHEENHEYHDPSIGHGSASYGIHVHETVCYRLTELKELPGVEVQRRLGSVEIRFGAFLLRPYKLGDSESDDVWSSYPNNVKSIALTQMANHNIAPPLPGLYMEESVTYTDFVIGHFGAFDDDHSEGCRAIYLCVPRYIEGNFGGWVSCVSIYDASVEEESYEHGASELPPVEVAEEPEVEFVEEPEVKDVGEDEDPSSKEEG